MLFITCGTLIQNQLVSPGIMHEICSIGYFSGESLKLIPADVRLKCTKFDFRLGSQLQRSPDPSWIEVKGPASKGQMGKEREGLGVNCGMGRRGEGSRKVMGKGVHTYIIRLIITYDTPHSAENWPCTGHVISTLVIGVTSAIERTWTMAAVYRRSTRLNEWMECKEEWEREEKGKGEV